MSEQITVAVTYRLKPAPRPKPGITSENWKLGYQRPVPVRVLAYKLVLHLFEFWASATGATTAEVNEELSKFRDLIAGLEMTEEPLADDTPGTEDNKVESVMRQGKVQNV